MYICI